MATASQPTPGKASVAGATTALVLLTALNFVNYIDRYILPGVQEQVKGEFRITDAQVGSLTLWFMVAYMAASPITGWLGDRFPRKPMIVVGTICRCQPQPPPQSWLLFPVPGPDHRVRLLLSIGGTP